jgi:hypothetical protein
MSIGFRWLAIVGCVAALTATSARAQVPVPPELVWLGQMGQTSSSGTDALSWSPQQSPDATTRVLLNGGGNFNRVVELGANNVTWYQMHLNNNGPATINGTGTITLAIPRDASGNDDALNGAQPSPDPFDPYPNVDEFGIYANGGEAFGGPSVPSVINPNVVTDSYIESNGSHSLTFNGKVQALTVQAYAGTNLVFNGDVTLTASPLLNDPRFITGNDSLPSVTFNAGVKLVPYDGFGATGFGIRNQMTVNLGPNAALSSDVSLTGWGELNLYNGSTLRLFGNNKLGSENDVWSRGANAININTLDLNGHSDSVEFLGTAGDATLIVNYGTTPGVNSLHWDSTQQINGQYSIVNFQIGTDVLELGAPGNGFWFQTGDPTTEAARLAQIKIDGVSFAPFNPATTTGYWTVVDPAVSRVVQFFNVNANFDGVNPIDGKDFLIWQRGLGATGQTNKSLGDADRNGVVNGADLVIWKAQFGTSPAATPVAGAVPEPASVTMMLVSVCGIGMARRRQASR